MMIFSRYSQSTRAALLCFVLRSSFMKRPGAILGSTIFLVIAPGTIAGYLPWTICQWRVAPPLFGFFSFRIAGVLMIAAGLPVLLDSFARFAIEGLGTPAPVVPPKCLLVSGLYRYVRNPMYVALSLMIFGQGLLFGSVGLLEYGVVVWLGFFVFVVLYEEPTLRGKFGSMRNTAPASRVGFRD
jgi:hypothetical protein